MIVDATFAFEDSSSYNNKKFLNYDLGNITLLSCMKGENNICKIEEIDYFSSRMTIVNQVFNLKKTLVIWVLEAQYYLNLYAAENQHY